MRTNQWVRAGNGVEAVINAIVWKTAIVWVPVVAIGVGVVAWDDARKPKTYSAYECGKVSEELLNAGKAFAEAKYVGELESARKWVARIDAERQTAAYKRDCAPVQAPAPEQAPVHKPIDVGARFAAEAKPAAKQPKAKPVKVAKATPQSEECAAWKTARKVALRQISTGMPATGQLGLQRADAGINKSCN